ncbi:CocE/NonD family hydrolase [Solirubrobacter soli]|uniref:CocE/NonD family hydrolase n=1 Tax=Solirubrobacter soli TaxID=363832 RepID=UPI0003FC8568|nr:CocE/NonD family hydrolase [Solirubrobacter soli]
MGLAAVVAACAWTSSAHAQAPPVIDTTGGKTQPVFGYADAIRERVFIESPYDSDKNNVKDIIAIDVKRPKATNEGLKAPVIMDPSPYYSTLGRGNESQLKRDYDNDGLLDLWPLFYDNWFVPRGYAVILMDMIGTNNSTGCPTVHDEPDNLSAKVVIDWLNGRTKGVDKNGVEVKAPWHNGKTGLIGKSYDGTLANAVAASGVEGLTTIVPISAIASYYDYTRTNGVIQRGNHYLASLSSTVTNPERRDYCLPVRNELSANDGDATGDYSDFWAVRDYLKDLDKVKASVFITHGVQDENVRADHFSKWWYGLKERNVPRKLWILRQGHVDPFDGRRAVWVDTIHRWFDYWLQGVQNGIMSEPAVDIEESRDNWKSYADWPIPGTKMTDVFLRGTTATTNGELGGASGGATDSLTFRDANLSENNMLSLTNGQTNKKSFISAPLKQPLRMSGTAIIDLQASLSKTQSNLTALIVDYGNSTQTNRNGDGVANSNPVVRSCWGESVPDDTPCFIETTKPQQTVTQWRVTKGMMDSSNRNSLRVAEPVTIGSKYRFTFPELPEDYTFAAGHRIGIVIGANFSAYGSTNGMTQTDITLDTKLSKVSLPIVGGYDAAVAAGAFVPETVAPEIGAAPDITVDSASPTTTVTYATPAVTDNEDPSPDISCTPASGTTFHVGQTIVTCTASDANGNTSTKSFTVTVRGTLAVGASVPATLALTLGAPATFGAFTAGVQKEYTAATSANVISTAGDAALKVADPGRLMNGAFALPEPLQVSFSKSAWTAPVSNDAVAITFKQLIKATDALRTGAYSKTLTFTLSTTSP